MVSSATKEIEQDQYHVSNHEKDLWGLCEHKPENQAKSAHGYSYQAQHQTLMQHVVDKYIAEHILRMLRGRRWKVVPKCSWRIPTSRLLIRRNVAAAGKNPEDASPYCLSEKDCMFRDCTVSPGDSMHVEDNDRPLRVRRSETMKPCHVVLILVGVYAT